jgi:hypothetical protein
MYHTAAPSIRAKQCGDPAGSRAARCRACDLEAAGNCVISAKIERTAARGAYPRAMRRLGVVLIGLSFAACQSKPAGTVPSPRAGLRVTTPTVARQLSRHTQHVNVPFLLAEQGVNGTGLLIAFLQRMQIYGAIYVSDVSYALQMTYNGATVECVSKIDVLDGSRPAAVAEALPDDQGDAEFITRVKPWRPRTTDAWVVDRDMVCEQHAQQVAAHEPRYENSYNAEIRRLMPPGYMPHEDTAIVFYDECAYRPNRRYVHRYEHFIQARFSPPDLEVIRRSYSDLPLVHEPPLCHEIKLAPGQPLRQHIDADVHYPSTIVPERENDPPILEPVPRSGGDRPSGGG